MIFDDPCDSKVLNLDQADFSKLSSWKINEKTITQFELPVEKAEESSYYLLLFVDAKESEKKEEETKCNQLTFVYCNAWRKLRNIIRPAMKC